MQLFWTREEDIKYDFFRPASSHKISAGLDAQGHMVACSFKVATQSISERALPALIQNGIDPVAVQGLGDQDYEIPNLEVKWVKLDLPIPVGFLRSVGHSFNAFVVECFIDEAAHAAGKDPLAYRLDMLKSKPYAAGVLRTAAEKSRMGQAAPQRFRTRHSAAFLIR